MVSGRRPDKPNSRDSSPPRSGRGDCEADCFSARKQGQSAETIPQSPVIFVLTAVKRADVLAAKTVKIQKKHKQIYDIIKAETM